MTATTVTTSRISTDEFLSGDYPTGSELIDGVVHIDDATFRHQRLCQRVNRALLRWSDGPGGHGEVGWGGNWILSDGHVHTPDVWWTAEPPDGTRHDGPPELAVEVRSPGTWHLDIGRELATHRDAGTRELWLVDTPASAVLVHREGAFDDGVEVGPGEHLTSPLFPGFALAIDELFGE